MNVTKLSRESQPYIKALIYGEAGSGKTTLASTFPKPMLFFDFDGKMRSIADVDGIEVVSYPVVDRAKVKEVFGQFLKDWKEVRKDLRWRSIVWDGLSSIDPLALRYFVMLSGKGPEDKPQIQHYGDLADFYTFFFREITSLPCNVLCLAHEQFVQDEDQGIYSVMPLITGSKILPKLPTYWQEVWYLENNSGQKVRRLHFNKFKKAIALSCSLKGDPIDNPCYEVIKKRGE